MEVRRVKNWFTRNFLGYHTVSEVSTRPLAVDEFFVDLTCEPNHTYYLGRDNPLFLSHNCDDLASEKIALTATKEVWHKIWEWFQTGPVQRTQPGESSIILVGTRWSAMDPIGQVQRKMAEDPAFPRFTITEFPAILPSGNALWPDFWPIDKLQQKKASIAPYMWAAQYMQDPSSDGAAIIPKDTWKVWEDRDPPPCDLVVAALDTAHSTGNSNDYSALVVLGRFFTNGQGKLCKSEDDDATPAFIVLDVVKKRLDFPALKAMVIEKYQEHKWDSFVVERTAAGAPLISELSQIGLYARPFVPTRATGDKIVRTNAVADVWHSSTMWVPTHRWAQELVEDMHAFPNGEHDDTHDACIMAVSHLRAYGAIELKSDKKLSTVYNDEDDELVLSGETEAFY